MWYCLNEPSWIHSNTISHYTQYSELALWKSVTKYLLNTSSINKTVKAEEGDMLMSCWMARRGDTKCTRDKRTLNEECAKFKWHGMEEELKREQDNIAPRDKRTRHGGGQTSGYQVGNIKWKLKLFYLYCIFSLTKKQKL